MIILEVEHVGLCCALNSPFGVFEVQTIYPLLDGTLKYL